MLQPESCLMKYVCESCSFELVIENIVCCSDSQIVWLWLHNLNRALPVYVRNMVDELTTLNTGMSLLWATQLTWLHKVFQLLSCLSVCCVGRGHHDSWFQIYGHDECHFGRMFSWREMKRDILWWWLLLRLCRWSHCWNGRDLVWKIGKSCWLGVMGRY